MASQVLQTTCCVVGGGPAGIVLAYLLAEKGIDVTVLEKHKDFFRDFRGDTVHPSTLNVLSELGLLEEFLQLPHERVASLDLIIGDSQFHIADFSHVPAACKFVALMPQWDFLNFLSSRAKRFPSFQLLMQHEATGLITEGGHITGVIARNEDREVRIQADLVVGCDGRHSITRSVAGMKVIEHGVPVDVLWFRISRKPDDPAQVLGNVNYGKALILINRSDYFQAGLIIKKGTYAEIQAHGLEAFRTDIRNIAPYLGDRVNEVDNWDKVQILTVQINRLRRWYLPGLLCIGDAAHAMSPAGGVGINLAIQDAVAAARILTPPLQARHVPVAALAAVENRRMLPTRVTQAFQLAAHRGIARVFENQGPIQPPWQLKAAVRIPGIQRAVGYAVGVGFRPEHVRNQSSAPCKCSRVSGAVLAGIGLAAAGTALILTVWKARNKSAAQSA